MSVHHIAPHRLAQTTRDPDAAFRRDNIVDFERHRISRVYRRMCAEIDRAMPLSEARATREPNRELHRVSALQAGIAIASILVAVFCISFFAAAFVSAWGQM